MIPEDLDGKRSQTVGERAPSNVQLKVELQKKERVKKKFFKQNFIFIKNIFLGN